MVVALLVQVMRRGGMTVMIVVAVLVVLMVVCFRICAGDPCLCCLNFLPPWLANFHVEYRFVCS